MIDDRFTGRCWGRIAVVALAAIPFAVACSVAREPQPSETARAELADAPRSESVSDSGTMTLPGADGTTTRFGEAMRLEDLPEWLAVPDGVAPTGEGFVVTSAEGRRTGSIRLAMTVDADTALGAWTDALAEAGLHVQRQDSGEIAAGFVVGIGDGGRRVHVSVTGREDGVECAVQYAGP